MPTWNSAQYLKFKQERTQPAIDLAAKIPLEKAGRVLDVGCGPGNSTRVLSRRFPEAEVVGVDTSPEMVRAAQEEMPYAQFHCMDAGGDLSALGAGYDVVFSNACLQWIPGHAQLVPRLLGLLRPGGVLAVQLPINEEEPIHKIIQRVAKARPWAEHIGRGRVFYTLRPEAYYDLLAARCTTSTLWETHYYHILGGHDDIIEWYRGTGLRPYLQALPEALQATFEAEVYQQVQQVYPTQQDGRVIFRFPRLFFMGQV